MDEEFYRPTREERKEVTLGIRAAVGIRNGQQCANHAQDQQHIIFLLNKISNTAGGTLYPTGPVTFKTPREGYCDPSLSNLISTFQQRNGLKADGVVDPDGPTLKALNMLSTGRVSPRPAPHPVIPQPHVDALNELLDICYGLSKDLSLGPNSAQFRFEVAGIAKDIESEMAKTGIPNRQRRRRVPTVGNVASLTSGLPPGVRLPVVNNVAVKEIETAIGLIEFLLLAFAALVLLGALYLLLRKLVKTLRLYLLLLVKTAIAVLTEIKMAVAKEEARAKSNRCRAEDIAAFYQATNNFTRALESGYSTKSVLRPVASAWWNSLKRLFLCMGESFLQAVMLILVTNLSFSLTFWEWLHGLLN